VKRANGNHVWEWRYRVNGRMKQQMLRVADFPTAKAVKAHLEHSVSALNQATEKILPGAVTVGMLTDRYIKEYLPDLAKSTRDTWEGVLRKHIKPHWDKVPALAVKPMAVDAWIKTLPLAASSKGRARRLLKQLIDRAMYWDLIPNVTNPTKPRRIQATSATRLITFSVDQYFWKLKAPSGRKSSAGAFHPSDFLGRAFSDSAMSSSCCCE